MTDSDLSPDGKLFAFDSRGGTQDDIFVLGSDGKGLRQLTDDVYRDRHPAFSPDGKRLAFHSDRSGRYDIWTIATDGSGLAQMTKSTGDTIIEPLWSPDGKHVATNSGKASFVATLDEKGVAAKMQKIPEPGPSTFFLPLAWSGDGQHLLGAVSRLPDRQTNGLLFYSPETNTLSEPFHGIKTAGNARRGSFLGNRAVHLDNDGIHVADLAAGNGAARRARTPTSGATTTSCAAARRPATWSARATTPTSGSAPRARRPGDAGIRNRRMALQCELKTKDIVLFNVAAIVGMRWIALAAANGPSSLFLWVLAAIVFFIPQGFAVTALTSAMPEEGGLYVWTSKAFGQRQGFLAGWLYWASNITYFPTLTLSTVVFALYIFGTRFAALEQSATYAAGASLALLVIALGLNIVGMKTGKWVQNIGGLAQWLPSLALLVIGLIALFTSGSATPMPVSSLIPDFAALPTVLFFANLCFGYAGLELAPTMAGEVVEPRKTFPRAISISGLTIAACYLLGTVSILWALPRSEVSILSGVNQAITKAGAAHGLPWLGAPMALLMTLAGLGGVGAWLIATARLLFCGGLDRYLPPIFAKTHPKWKTPWFAMVFQAAFSAIFIIAATQGATVKEAYLKLVNATLIVYFMPYMYMFASAIKLRAEIARQPGAVPVPGGSAGSIFWNGLGFVTTVVAIVLALIPPADTADKTSFFVQVFVGSFGFLAAGIVLYALAERRRRRCEAAAAA